MGFYSNTLTLAFNSDCSRAVLSASGKINDCPSSKEKPFDTEKDEDEKKKKKEMFEDSWWTPASQNTNLTFCQSPGGTGFFPYLQQRQQTSFPTCTAEIRHSFPLTSCTAMVTVSFHFSPQTVDAVSTPSLSFKCKVCYHKQGRITAPRELLLLSSMNTTEICTLQWTNKCMNDQPLN